MSENYLCPICDNPIHSSECPHYQDDWVKEAITLRKQLELAMNAVKGYNKLIDDDLNENGQPLNKEWSHAYVQGLDALAEIERIRKEGENAKP